MTAKIKLSNHIYLTSARDSYMLLTQGIAFKELAITSIEAINKFEANSTKFDIEDLQSNITEDVFVQNLDFSELLVHWFKQDFYQDALVAFSKEETVESLYKFSAQVYFFEILFERLKLASVKKKFYKNSLSYAEYIAKVFTDKDKMKSMWCDFSTDFMAKHKELEKSNYKLAQFIQKYFIKIKL